MHERMSDEKVEIEFDENGIEKPMGKIFGIIPYYRGPFYNRDGTRKHWALPYLYVTPFALYIALKNYFGW